MSQSAKDAFAFVALLLGALLAMILIVAVATGISGQRTNTAITAMVQAGADPIQAACAAGRTQLCRPTVTVNGAQR